MWSWLITPLKWNKQKFRNVQFIFMNTAKPCGYHSVAVILHCGPRRTREEEHSHDGRENWDRVTQLNFARFADFWLKMLSCGFVQCVVFMWDKLQLRGILSFLGLFWERLFYVWNTTAGINLGKYFKYYKVGVPYGLLYCCPLFLTVFC